MKRFLFIVIPYLQNDAALQPSDSAFLHQITSLRYNEDFSTSDLKQRSSRMDLNGVSHTIGRLLANRQNGQNRLNVVGSTGSLTLLLEQLEITGLLSEFPNGEKRPLLLHPVLREKSGAETQISRLYQLIDSSPGCMLSTIIDAKHAQDTSNRWGRTEIYYRMLMHSEGELFTDQHLANLAKQTEAEEVCAQVPAVHHHFDGIQKGDSLIIIPDEPGEFEQIYRSFHRERFAPFVRSEIELNHLELIAPSPAHAQALLSRLAAHLSDRNIRYLKYGSMQDYFFLTSAASTEAQLPDSWEERIFFSENSLNPSDISDYFEMLSNQVASDRYRGIFTSLPLSLVESETDEIFDSVNRSLVDLMELAKERGYSSLFCLPVDHNSVLLYQRDEESNQQLPGKTVDELFTNLLERLN